jgi:hypothetical protein
MFFNAKDWYWFVVGDLSKVYSSKRSGYVDPQTDEDYQTWSKTWVAPMMVDESDIWYYTGQPVKK